MPVDIGDQELRALAESAPYLSPGAFAVVASRGSWRMAAHHAVMDLALTKVADGEIKRLIVEMPPRHGKALALDTPLPTPTGWTTIGEVQVGDTLYDERRQHCRVVAKSDVFENRALYEVITDCGDAIVADGEHEWPVVGGLKLTRQMANGCLYPLSCKRANLAVQPLGVGRTQCIEVDSPSHLFLAGRSMTPTHNSELCSRYFPAWAMMRRPFTNMIVTGATADLANEFSQKSRELVQEYGVGMFNTTIAGGRKRLSDWALTNGSRARAAGVGGNIMGRGADIFIIDDYFKNADSALSELQRRKLMSWYLSTAQTRLSPDGAVVIIATRWHPDDLIGRLLRLESQGGDKWTRIRFPAIAEPGDPLGRAEGEALWPDQWPLQHLEDKRQAFMLGGHPWMWDALYQQKPPATLDATWEPELFEGDDIWFTEWPDPRDVQFRVAALDPSLGESEKSDYSAIVYGAVTNDGYIYVGANIGRRDPFKIVEASIDVCRMFGPNAFAVESNQYQKFLAQYFQKAVFEAGLLNPVVCINNTKEKTGRIKAGLSHLLRSRRIKFRSRTPGVALLMEQLRGFPGTEHDDGPDALEMMVRLATMIHSGQLPK